MSKLLSNVLDKISEDNNSYRTELRNLNKDIDEKTTALVGDIVTLSNYTIDFSDAVTNAKDKLTNPISRIIESYVIKDLRSVETVNEQFVDKINDKIDNTNINNSEEKENFIQNLNALLNDKYLEIVKIKRVSFLNESGINEDIENAINDFTTYLENNIKANSKINDVIIDYKKDLYDMLSNTLQKISDLYLNNFVSTISNSLNMSLDVEGTIKFDEEEKFEPYIPEIPEVPNIPEVPDIAVQESFENEIEENSVEPQNIKEDSLEIPEVPEMPIISDTTVISDMPSYENLIKDDFNIEPEIKEEASPIYVTPIAPIEIVEEKKEEPKKTYDVEEILKIAKSPVVTMPNEMKKEDDSYLSVLPIKNEEEKESISMEFDEKEIVEEMINRLTKRLSLIKEREEKLEEEKAKIEEDEAFVNDLIESSNSKKLELDKFEEELNEKEKELDQKQKDLDKKINDVLPFAEAVMKTSNEEA